MPVRRVAAKALTLAVATAALACPAAAAEQRVRGAELNRMITEGTLLCEEPEHGRCKAILRWDATAGVARETRLETVGGDPIVDMALQFPIRIENDQVCLTIRADEIGYLFLVAGREIAAGPARPMLEAVRSVWAAAEGRVWCTAYYRDTVTGMLRAEVRIDGAPRLELDSVMQPITTSPLPALRIVRQPWSAGVLRAAALLPPETAGEAARPPS